MKNSKRDFLKIASEQEPIIDHTNSLFHRMFELQDEIPYENNANEPPHNDNSQDKCKDNSDYLYATYDGEALIRSYRGTTTHITIPETLDGCEVTRIGDNAFEDNEVIESVDFPSCLHTIGEKAFKNCKKLKSVSFSKALMRSLIIKREAFSGCNISTPLVLNTECLSIGYSAFSLNYKIPFIILLSSDIVFQDSPFDYCESVKFVYMYPSATARYSGHFWNSKVGDVFVNMKSLEKVLISNTSPFLNENTFTGSPKVVVYAQDKQYDYLIEMHAVCCAILATQRIL